LDLDSQVVGSGFLFLLLELADDGVDSPGVLAISSAACHLLGAGIIGPLFIIVFHFTNF
jgi:hypothetical protein